MVEIVRTETVGEDGVLHVEMEGLEPGTSVQVIVRRGGWPVPELRQPDEHGRYRTVGGLEGQVWIADDFDAPLDLREDSSEGKPKRRPGSLKGLFTVPPEFDDPIPGLEEYS